jgi:hypothetical protein
MGIRDVATVAVEPTLGGIDLRDAARDRALAFAREAATKF